MDLQKSKVLLKKINALHDSAIAFDGTFSKLERDLILHYLRDFYEELSGDNESATQQSAHVPQVVAPSTPKVSIAAPVVTPVTSMAPEDVLQPAPPPPTNAAPAPAPAAPAPTPPVLEPVQSASPPPIKATISAAYNALFEEDGVGDVSSKYALSPLSDIGKGMGINDRILMINSLFGGDQQKFASAIENLNKLSSMDDAKHWLADGPAKSFDWTDDQKSDVAKRFVALVRRRYL